MAHSDISSSTIILSHFVEPFAGHIFDIIKGEHANLLLHYVHECTFITALYHEYMLSSIYISSSHRDPERFLRWIEEHVVRWFKQWSYIAREKLKLVEVDYLINVMVY